MWGFASFGMPMWSDCDSGLILCLGVEWACCARDVELYSFRSVGLSAWPFLGSCMNLTGDGDDDVLLDLILFRSFSRFLELRLTKLPSWDPLMVLTLKTPEIYDMNTLPMPQYTYFIHVCISRFWCDVSAALRENMLAGVYAGWLLIFSPSQVKLSLYGRAIHILLGYVPYGLVQVMSCVDKFCVMFYLIISFCIFLVSFLIGY